MKFIVTIFLLFPTILFAQEYKIKMLNDSANTSLRGLSAVDENVVWVSGSKGQVARTTNGGQTWKWITVKGYEKKELRDIEAFDSLTAIAMVIDNPATILKTTDGGETWKTVFYKEGEGMFLDAMDFVNELKGICIGDPITIDGKKYFYIIWTNDGGETWKEFPAEQLPQPQTEGEAIFAASGSNIHYLGNKKYKYAFVTGGKQSNLYLAKKAGGFDIKNIPITQGKEATGAFSMWTNGKNEFYFAGGDYTKKDNTDSNFCYRLKISWMQPTTKPNGYRSCVIKLKNKTLLTTGINGTDISYDNGINWVQLTNVTFMKTVGFNTVAKSKKGNAVFFCGDKGKIWKLTNEPFLIKNY